MIGHFNQIVGHLKVDKSFVACDTSRENYDLSILRDVLVLGYSVLYEQYELGK